jgi:hypothetical protein
MPASTHGFDSQPPKSPPVIAATTPSVEYMSAIPST